MNAISLFTGGGGIDIAAMISGFRVLAMVEKDYFCRNILRYHFPKTPIIPDIRLTEYLEPYKNDTDVLYGGFPCQPFSRAGSRKSQDDDRYLWPEMLESIRAVKPAWILGENVHGLIDLEQGVHLEKVCADLEAEGFEVLKPLLLPAISVNAPHERYRVFIVAHSHRNRHQIQERRRLEKKSCVSAENRSENNKPREPERTINVPAAWGLVKEFIDEQEAEGRIDEVSPNLFTSFKQWISDHKGFMGAIDIADPNHEAVYHKPREVSATAAKIQAKAWEENWKRGWGKPGPIFHKSASEGQIPYSRFPTVSPFCIGDDGFSETLGSIPFSTWRTEAIKLFGNAVVPDVVLPIFESIKHCSLKLQ